MSTKWSFVSVAIVSRVRDEHGNEFEVETGVVTEGCGWMNDDPMWGQKVFEQVVDDCGEEVGLGEDSRCILGEKL